MQPGTTVEPSDTDATSSTDVLSADSDAETLYHPKTDKALGAPPAKGHESGSEQLTWQASEYVDHEKSAGWYVLLAGVAVVIAGLVLLLTGGDIVTAVVVVIAAVLFGVVAARRPRTLDYTIDSHGVTIGDKLYAYADLKTFSLITDTPLHSVQLLPLKRFMPPIGVYFPPEQEEQVVQTLGRFLPYEQRGLDGFDRLMSRIRF